MQKYTKVNVGMNTGIIKLNHELYVNQMNEICKNKSNHLYMNNLIKKYANLVLGIQKYLCVIVDDDTDLSLINNVYTLNQVKTPILTFTCGSHAKEYMYIYEKTTFTDALFLSKNNYQEHRNRDYRQIVQHSISEIIPNFMYLSGKTIAEDCQMLKKYKITHVLNVASAYVKSPCKLDIKYKEFDLLDSSEQQIIHLFEESNKFITSAKINNGRILIHCYAGISRSVSFIIAYLMKINRINLENSLMFIKSKRCIANPNQGFLIQLEKYYQMIIKKDYKDYS